MLTEEYRSNVRYGLPGHRRLARCPPFSIAPAIGVDSAGRTLGLEPALGESYASPGYGDLITETAAESTDFVVVRRISGRSGAGHRPAQPGRAEDRDHHNCHQLAFQCHHLLTFRDGSSGLVFLLTTVAGLVTVRTRTARAVTHLTSPPFIHESSASRIGHAPAGPVPVH